MKNHIEVNLNNVSKIRIGSKISQGRIKGQVIGKEKIPQPFFDLYKFLLNTGEEIKVIKSTL